MVDPKAKAIAQVRMKPVIREIMTKNEMSAADDPTFATSEAAPSASSLGSFVMELFVVVMLPLMFGYTNAVKVD